MLSQRIRGPAGNLAVVTTGTPVLASDVLPVVLVHSLAGNSSHWSAQLAHFGSSRLAVAIDLRGHGHSDPPANRDYSFVGMSADIAAVVEALKLERFLLVGHSMGGGASLAYAGSHPERIAGLVLVDPIGDGKQISPADAEPLLTGLDENYHSTIREYWSGIAGTNPAVRERLLADLDATPRDAVVGSFHETFRFDPDPWLAAYQGPILSIVTPFNDQPFSLHRLGKGFPYRMVHGTGHWIQLEKPAELNTILDEFIKSRSL
jgi:pimeloyl-ACP methyl ester carboxylesterase